jgi:acid phosphatase type 7
MNHQPQMPGTCHGRLYCGGKKELSVRKYYTSSSVCGWSRILISLIIFSALLTVAAYADSEVTGPDGANDTILWGPYITNTTHNSTMIHWKTLEPSIGRVSFTLSPGIPNQTLSERNPSELHQVQLNNLEPGERYSYYLGNFSGNYSFRTLPLDGTFTFIVYGDTREQLPWWNQLTHHALVAARIAEEPECLFVVHTGDLVNNPADEGEWGRFFEAAGPMLANTTFYPVPGNHEGNLTLYHERFGMPPWYSFQCSDARFIVLNSNAVSLDVASAQDKWLNATLGNNASWNFVFLHHPLFTSDTNHWGGYADTRDKWGPVFQSSGINAVFSAHVHAYEHFQVKGIHYFTVATGGAPSYPLSVNKPDGYVKSRENTLGYMRITVNSSQILLEFVPVAEVKDEKITIFPVGTGCERTVISHSPEKTPGTLTHSFNIIHPLFKSSIRFFQNY